MIFNKYFVNEITFWLWHRKKCDEEKRMCVTCKLELKKHLCENWGQLLNKMSKYQNNKISPIKAALDRKSELALLLTGSNNPRCIPYFEFKIFCRSWFKFLIGNFTEVPTRIFFPDWEPKFLSNLAHTNIYQDIGEVDGKRKVL